MPTEEAVTAAKVKKLVEEEGREARNLVVWNVPLDDKEPIVDNSQGHVPQRPPVSPRPQSASPKPPLCPGSTNIDSSANVHSHHSKRNSFPYGSKSSRVRSASAGRYPQKDLLARYWTFLFENLHRAVDEIYQTCETDESVLECKEAIMVLENYTKDFKSLIQWLNISKDFESTPPPNRPTSLAWEVRKSSPGKGLLWKTFFNQLTIGCNDTFCKSEKLRGISPVLSTAEVQTDTIDILSAELSKEFSQPPDSAHTHKMALTEPFSSEKAVTKDQSVEIKPSFMSSDSPLCETASPVANVTQEAVDDINVKKENMFLTNSMPSVVSLDSAHLKNSSSSETQYSVSSLDSDKECSLVNRSALQITTTSVNSLHTVINSSIIRASSGHPVSLPLQPAVDNAAPTNAVTLPLSTVPASQQATCNTTLPAYSVCHGTACNADTSSSSAENSIKSTTQTSLHQLPTAVGKVPSSPSSTKIASTVSSMPSVVRSFAMTVATNTKPTTSVTGTKLSKQTEVAVFSCTSKTVDSHGLSKPTCTTGGSTRSPTPGYKPPQRAVHILNTRPNYKSSHNLTASKPSAITGLTKTGPRYSKNYCTLAKIQTEQSQSKLRNGPFEELKGSCHYPVTPPAARQIFSNRATDSLPSKQMLLSNKSISRPPKTISRAQTLVKHGDRVPSNISKTIAKDGSSSSLSSTSSRRSWADKVKGELTDTLTTSRDDEDSEGWEIVRGKSRSRNSPAKKLPLSISGSSGKPYSDRSLLSAQGRSTSASNINIIHSKPQCNVLGFQHSTIPKSCKVQSNEPALPSQQLSSSSSMINLSHPVPCTHKKLYESKKKPVTAKSLPSLATLPSKGKPKHPESHAETTENSKSKNISHMKSDGAKVKRSNSFPSTVDVTSPLVSRKKCAATPTLQSTKEENIMTIKREHKILLTDEKNPFSTGRESLGIRIDEDNHLVEKIVKTSESEMSEILTDGTNFNDIHVIDLCSDDDKAIDSQTEEAIAEAEDGDLLSLLRKEMDTEGSPPQSPEDNQLIDWNEVSEAQEMIYELGLSWGDQMDRLDLELRTPGRALHMHEKLSSPFRRRSPSETIRRHEERQAKAQELRERLLEEKAQKFKGITKKVEEMRAWKEEQQQQKRITLEKRLQRAEEKRKIQLQKIVRKAHDEEEKVNEIAFINTLEAQNKRHDILSKEKDHVARLQDLQEERQRKQEEKAAKEAAAEERRRALQAERQARLLEMQERRKLRDMKIEQQLQEKEKERQELASQKARDREQRLSALNAIQQANLEELQKKIQQKQEESARRHEANMEQIRQKAFELSVRRYSSNNDDAPRLVPYETKKMCTLCNVLIGSEVYLLSHLRGKKHQEAVKDMHQGQDPSTEELESYNVKHIVDAPADKMDPAIALDKERQRALKKRCKKLRQRMCSRGVEYENMLVNKVIVVESTHKPKLQKNIREINKCLGNHCLGPMDNALANNLERSVGELERILEKHGICEQTAFRALGGIGRFMDAMNSAQTSPKNGCIIPARSLIRVCSAFTAACSNCYDNCCYILLSNKIGTLLDLLVHHLNVLIPDNYTQLLTSGPGFISVALPVDPVAGAMMQLIATILLCLSTKECQFIRNDSTLQNTKELFEIDEAQQRVTDVISYTVSIGIVDKLWQYMANVRGPIDGEPQVAVFLQQTLKFLTALNKVFENRYDKVFEKKKAEDSTQLVATFRVTELVGTVSMLYGMLLHSGAPSRGQSAPPKLPPHTVAVTLKALRMLTYFAVVDLQVTQSVLGNEGLSLQLRHIASYLVWYCSHWDEQDLLHEVILLVGYFTVLNPDNQVVMQSGQRPTVLQQLCVLPFYYFSDPHLSNVLFPTLIACCHNNTHNVAILEQEMSPEMLSNYIEACLLDLHQTALLPSLQKKDSSKDEDVRWMLASRFPKDRWTAAKDFFSAAAKPVATGPLMP